MRTNRMRAALAGVLGMALIGIASPAWATPPTSETTPTESATPAAEGTATASPTPTEAPIVVFGEEPTSTPTSPTPTPDGLVSVDPSATPVAPGAVTESATATPTSITTTTGDALIDSFLPVLPFKIDFGKQIDDPTDLDINPLLLSFTCTDAGPHWKIQNLANKAYGFGWFDTNLGGGIADIGPLQTLDIPSNALAVIASPWDGETKVILVTVPSVGVSDCPGTPPAAVPPAAFTPVGLPAAPPAAAVPGEPYYTR